MDIVNKYLDMFKKLSNVRGYSFREHAPRMVCADGFSMSVQASGLHYCTPREDDAKEYAEVEVGFPSEKEDLLMPYAEESDNPTGTVYGYVPVDILEKIINKHGGIDMDVHLTAKSKQ